ncbi:MAG: TetR/AcrR family transcriptional regulator, partial [Actinomycetota bacterium]|nr:TetR/AcrR family transcriptional regulator [Actinomycetota bacterium]
MSSAATTSTTVTLRVPDPPAASARPSSASGRKHRAILDAAEDLFLAHGYLGTSMDDVAARAQ